MSSLEKLVAQTLQISYGDAKRRADAAADCGRRTTMLGQLQAPLRPVVAAAQADGDLSPVKVDLITRTLATVDLDAAEETADTEKILVASGTTFDPHMLGKICDRVLEHLDPDGSRPRDAVKADRRELHLGRCRDGMIRVDGRLTPAAGARVKAVLGPLAAPRPSIEASADGVQRVRIRGVGHLRRHDQHGGDLHRGDPVYRRSPTTGPPTAPAMSSRCQGCRTSQGRALATVPVMSSTRQRA